MICDLLLGPATIEIHHGIIELEVQIKEKSIIQFDNQHEFHIGIYFDSFQPECQHFDIYPNGFWLAQTSSPGWIRLQRACFRNAAMYYRYFWHLYTTRHCRLVLYLQSLRLQSSLHVLRKQAWASTQHIVTNQSLTSHSCLSFLDASSAVKYSH